MSARVFAFVAAGVAAAVAGVLLVARPAGLPEEAVAQAGPGAGPAADAATPADVVRSDAGGAIAPSGVDAGTGALAAWRQAHSSLRGSDLDGSWSVGPQGLLQPSLALRRRFDNLLLLRDGEAGTGTLVQMIRHEVQAEAGAEAAAQVLDVFLRYVGLLDMRFETRVDLARPETWGPALAERQRARRDRLGLAWAQAFYAEEEAELQALINAQHRAASSPADVAPRAAGVVVLGLQPAGLDPEQRAALNPVQQQRLQAVEADQQRWTRRVDDARREVEALNAAAHLSTPQRQEAIDAWVSRHFDAQEQRRVRALLDLPP